MTDGRGGWVEQIRNEGRGRSAPCSLQRGLECRSPPGVAQLAPARHSGRAVHAHCYFAPTAGGPSPAAAAPASPPVSVTANADPRSQGTPGQSPGQSGVRGGYPSKVCPRTPGPSPAVSPGPTVLEPSGPQPSSSHQTPLPLLSPRHSRPQGSRVQSQGRVGRHLFWLFVV